MLKMSKKVKNYRFLADFHRVGGYPQGSEKSRPKYHRVYMGNFGGTPPTPLGIIGFIWEKVGVPPHPADFEYFFSKKKFFFYFFIKNYKKL